jgi:photosystem II stability/assembly factor-like uncharacterized protein
MTPLGNRACLSIKLGLILGCASAQAQSMLPESSYAQLHWRLVGPFRGGWATMAVGVPERPDTFYFGAAGGGVWKTVNAGRTWVPVGSALPPTIGALAVAPTDPDTIYVGTGQPEPRYDISSGRGVYKSTDGGKTWSALGLEATKSIGAIWIDPRNAKVVVVAALGHFFGPDQERGIYRTTDGGRTWVHALAVGETTGAVDLAADPTNPNLLYAAAWEARGWPWLSYFQPVVGAGSGLYKSTDGGASWTRVNGQGWPSGPLGRIGLAVTHTARGTRVYATVDSEKEGGVWRTDDGGERWVRVNEDQTTFGTWYFARLTVDPRNADTVYAMGQSIRRSTDGGKTWTEIKGAPGGDDYHYLWINPKHPERWITASDQGAVVSVDDGGSWSDWYNQPTGQFYHLAADTRFPYWIYSGQQDSGTVGAASRSDYGSLTFRDWHPVGGDERDYMIPDPDDADLVYGSGLGGRVSRWDARTGQVANISPWPVSSYRKRPDTVKYRYGWIVPLVVTPTHPHALLAGAQLLFRSADRGVHWQIISPDLTGRRPGAANCKGEVAIAAATACGYGVINSIEPSPLAANLIWVGTDNGLIQLTRDGGKHWSEVAPPAVAPWAKISSLDASTQDQATAYAVVDNQRQDDFRPHVLRTHDFGKSWTEIDTGLPQGEFVSVVRSDPIRRGLLYAGAAEGVYVSFDDGDHWQSLQLDLPKAWVRDLLVHGNDLIAATQGRAIWVLDELTPLRQLAPAVLKEPAHLFSPASAWRVHPNNNRDTPLPPETPAGENPPAGALIDYWLGEGAHGPVTLEIRDSAGALVRRFSSDEKPEPIEAERYFEAQWLKPEPTLSAAPGMHRFAWNLRYPRPRAIDYEYSIAAIFGEDTPTNIEGPFVLPGTYQVVLQTTGGVLRAPLVVKPDPRVRTSAADLQSLLSFNRALDGALERARAGNDERKGVHDKLEALVQSLNGDSTPGSVLGEAVSLRDATANKKAETDFGAISGRLAALAADAESADLAPTPAQREVFAQYSDYLQQALRHWRAQRAGALVQLNAHLRAAKLPAIDVPSDHRD